MWAVPAYRRGSGSRIGRSRPRPRPEKRLLGPSVRIGSVAPEGSRFVGRQALSVASHRKAFGVDRRLPGTVPERLFYQLFKAPFRKAER